MGTCGGAPAGRGPRRAASEAQGRSRGREGSGGRRSGAVASHQAEDCSRHAQAPRRFCVREFCRRRDPCEGGRAARGERPRVTSAAGRIITTWRGHCFSPARSAAGRARGGGLPGSPPPSPLGKVRWEQHLPRRARARASTTLGLSFFSLQWRCVGWGSFLVPN